MPETQVIPDAYRRYRKQALQWFDYELTHAQKSTLLQAFPLVFPHLKGAWPQLTEQPHWPKGKEEVCEQLAAYFTQTLGPTELMKLTDMVEVPKHFLQQEMAHFLYFVVIACGRTNHKPAFKAH